MRHTTLAIHSNTNTFNYSYLHSPAILVKFSLLDDANCTGVWSLHHVSHLSKGQPALLVHGGVSVSLAGRITVAVIPAFALGGCARVQIFRAVLEVRARAASVTIKGVGLAFLKMHALRRDILIAVSLAWIAVSRIHLRHAGIECLIILFVARRSPRIWSGVWNDGRSVQFADSVVKPATWCPLRTQRRN